MIDTADLPTAWRVRVLVDAAVQIAHFVTGMGDHCEQNVDHSCPRKTPILGATLLEVLNEHRATIYLHCGIPVKLRDLLSLPRTYGLTYANPLGAIPAANAFPDVKSVIPHFGAGFFREALIAGAQCPNVYVDTSSSNSWIKTQPQTTTVRDVFERALEDSLCQAER